MTQSTLSVGIAELERQLGTQLVERSTRRVRFTAVGEEILARARGIIRMAEDLVGVAQGARAPLVGSIRMAAIPTVAPFLLPRILTRVGQAWPRLGLVVREMLTGPACEALHRGTTDCVLLALPADCGDVETCEAAVDRLVLAIPAGEAVPLGSVSFEAIDVDRLLLLEDGHCLRDHALAVCQGTAPSREAPLVASTLDTLVRLVDAGLGLTLLPQMAVAAGILNGLRVESRAIDGPLAERRIALAWRRGHSRADEFRLLAKTVRDDLRLVPLHSTLPGDPPVGDDGAGASAQPRFR